MSRQKPVATAEVDLKPMRNRILVQPIANKVEMVGSLHVPDQAQKIATEGYIIAVGDGPFNEQGMQMPITDLKAGDRIYYGQYAGTEIELGQTRFLLMSPDEVLALILEN